MKDEPLSIKLISILLFISFIISILSFFGIIGSKELINSIMNKVLVGEGNQWLITFFNGFLNLINFILIPSSVLFLIAGIGLLSGKEWARMLTIALSVVISIISFLGILVFGIKSIFFINFLVLALSLVVGGYLLFNKKVNKFFS